MSQALTTAHSVVAPTPLSRRIAATLVILYAVVSITLKREAFEKWRTGYSSALAIILFVAVFGLANIYVKALNAVKNR
jgi:ABC-type sugar transport system permease subunit